MDRLARMKFPIPKEEFIHPGHTGCPGCGVALAMRYALKALGKKTIMVIPPGCAGVISGTFPFSAMKIPVLKVAFETTAICASGVRATLEMMEKKDVNVLAWGGDGATFDIGLQALSGVAERNDDIIYVCYNNEAYMNTGNQRSSATPKGAWTTTTPDSKNVPKKDIVQIMAAHKIPYIATASVGYPMDLIKKIKKAKDTSGTRFILIFTPCPTGWRYSPELTIRMAKLATETGIFPLYEIENGERYCLNRARSKRPLEEYISLQGRFRNLDEQGLQQIKERVKNNWEYLIRMTGEA